MKIRKATRKDLDEIQKLNMKMMKEIYSFSVRLENPEKVRKGYHDFIEKTFNKKNSVFFVAEDDGKLIGFSSGVIHKKDIKIYKYDKFGFVYDVFVLKKYRKSGIGKTLTNEILKWFKSKGLGWASLWVYTKNKNAYKTWERMGFKEDFIEMCMRLK